MVSFYGMLYPVLFVVFVWCPFYTTRDEDRMEPGGRGKISQVALY